MHTNLATLPQDEMDKVNVDLAALAWRLKSAITCRSSPKWLNVNSQRICETGSANA